jgi:hypothetical protein
LRKLDQRIRAAGWTINLTGVNLTVDMVQRATGEVFRLAIVADEYPLMPVAVHFLPALQRPAEAKWPFDGNYVFRTNGSRPFVCLSGIRSFVPDSTDALKYLGTEEIHIGAVLGNLDKALNDPRCTGAVYLPLK